MESRNKDACEIETHLSALECSSRRHTHIIRMGILVNLAFVPMNIRWTEAKFILGGNTPCKTDILSELFNGIMEANEDLLIAEREDFTCISSEYVSEFGIFVSSIKIRLECFFLMQEDSIMLILG